MNSIVKNILEGKGIREVLLKEEKEDDKFSNIKKKIEKIYVKRIIDDDADLSYLGEFSNTPKKGAITHSEGGREYKYFNPADPDPKLAKKDYERILDYGEGWHTLGIKAFADILIKKSDSWLSNTISSSGLWSIESDSEESYFKEIEEDELEDLYGTLENLGFSKEEIKKVPVENAEKD